MGLRFIDEDTPGQLRYLDGQEAQGAMPDALGRTGAELEAAKSIPGIEAPMVATMNVPTRVDRRTGAVMSVPPVTTVVKRGDPQWWAAQEAMSRPTPQPSGENVPPLEKIAAALSSGINNQLVRGTGELISKGPSVLWDATYGRVRDLFDRMAGGNSVTFARKNDPVANALGAWGRVTDPGVHMIPDLVDAQIRKEAPWLGAQQTLLGKKFQDLQDSIFDYKYGTTPKAFDALDWSDWVANAAQSAVPSLIGTKAFGALGGAASMTYADALSTVRDTNQKRAQQGLPPLSEREVSNYLAGRSLEIPTEFAMNKAMFSPKLAGASPWSRGWNVVAGGVGEPVTEGVQKEIENYFGRRFVDPSIQQHQGVLQEAGGAAHAVGTTALHSFRDISEDPQAVRSRTLASALDEAVNGSLMDRLAGTGPRFNTSMDDSRLMSILDPGNVPASRQSMPTVMGPATRAIDSFESGQQPIFRQDAAAPSSLPFGSPLGTLMGEATAPSAALRMARMGQDTTGATIAQPGPAMAGQRVSLEGGQITSQPAGDRILGMGQGKVEADGSTVYSAPQYMEEITRGQGGELYVPGTASVLKPMEFAPAIPTKGKPLLLVFGGTFNPVHSGHLSLPFLAMKMLRERGYNVDKVVTTPSPNYFVENKVAKDREEKGTDSMPTTLGERGALISKAYKGLQNFEVDLTPSRLADEEFQRSGKTQGRSDTGEYFKRKYPNHTVVMVAGEDTAPSEMQGKSSPIFGGVQHGKEAGNWFFVMPRDDTGISSSKVRRADTSIPYEWMPEHVAHYYLSILGKTDDVAVDGSVYRRHADNFAHYPLPVVLPDRHPLLQPTNTRATVFFRGREMPRQEMADLIVNSYLSKARPAPADRRPIVYVFGGGMSTGKGYVKDTLIGNGYVPDNLLNNDPDEIRKKIPEFGQIVAAGDYRAGEVTQKEAAAISHRITREAMAMRSDFILDTSLSDSKWGPRAIQDLKDAGYDVRLYGVTSNPVAQVSRMYRRGEATGRYIDTKKLLGSQKGFMANWETLAMMADQAELFDTEDEPRLIAKRGEGDSGITVINEGWYDRAIKRSALNEHARTFGDIEEARPVPSLREGVRSNGRPENAGREQVHPGARAGLDAGDVAADAGVQGSPAANGEEVQPRVPLSDDASSDLIVGQGEGKKTKFVDVESPEFRAWWGEDSNLVGDDGKPLRLYHGTDKAFRMFVRSKTGVTGSGVYLGDAPEVADTYAGDGPGANIVPVYARGKYIGIMAWSKMVQDAGGSWEKARAEAERQGIAGIWDQKFENAVNVFDPMNIKSSVSNTGEFSRTNRDIMGQGEAKMGRQGKIEQGLIKRMTLEEMASKIPNNVKVVSNDPRHTINGKPFASLNLKAAGRGLLLTKDLGATGTMEAMAQMMDRAANMFALPDDIRAKIQIPSVDRWNDALSLPDEARYWYELSADAFGGGAFRLPPHMVDWLIDVVAATSGNQAPYYNMRNAIAALSQELRRVPVTVGVRDPESMRVALSDQQLATQKFGSFAGTMQLLSGLRAEKPLPTIDLRMAHWFGLSQEEVASDPRLYGTLAMFLIHLRDAQNNRLERGAQPYESWQIQALAWTLERGGEDPEDYASVMPKVIRELQEYKVDDGHGNMVSAGIPTPGGKVTMETLLHPRTAEALARMTKIKGEGITGTVETATYNTEAGVRARAVLDELSSRPEAWAKNLVDRYYKILGAAARDLTSKKKGGPGEPKKVQSPLSRLVSAIIGGTPAGYDVRSIKDGQGTYNHTPNPNIRIPMVIHKNGAKAEEDASAITLTEKQVATALAYLGKAFKQSAMAASQFSTAEDNAAADTYTLFVHRTDGVGMPLELLSDVSRFMGYDVNYTQAPNGWVIDINGDFSGDAPSFISREEVETAAASVLSEHDVIIIRRKFSSIYLDGEADYDKYIQEFENGVRQGSVEARSRQSRDSERRLGDLSEALRQIQEIAQRQDDAVGRWADDARSRIDREGPAAEEVVGQGEGRAGVEDGFSRVFGDMASGSNIYGSFKVGTDTTDRGYRFLVPPTVTNRYVYPLDIGERRTMAAALNDIVDHGFPKSVIDQVKGFVTYDNKYSMFHALFLPQHGAIGIREQHLLDMVGSEGYLRAARGWLIHELSHVMDRSASGTHSSSSPRLQFFTHADGVTYVGDIIEEAAKAYAKGGELGRYLAYPFDYIKDYEPSSIKEELFAQLSALFHTNPSLMKAELPVAYKAMETIYAESKTQSFAEVVRHLQETLRTSGPGATVESGRNGRLAAVQGIASTAGGGSFGGRRTGAGVGGRATGRSDLNPFVTGKYSGEKYSGNINLNRVITLDEIRSTIEAMTAEIDVEQARGGRVSHAQTQALADSLGLTEAQLKSRTQGEAITPAYAVAARRILVNRAETTRALAQKAIASNDATDAAAAMASLYQLAAIQAVVMNVAAEAGRILNSFNILAEAAVGTDFQAAPTTHTQGGGGAGMGRAGATPAPGSASGGGQGGSTGNVPGGPGGGSAPRKTPGAQHTATTILNSQFGGTGNVIQILTMIAAMTPSQIAAGARKTATRQPSMLLEIWKAGLLSGPQTHIVNMASNLLVSGMRVGETGLASLIGAFHGGDRVVIREVAALTAGLIYGTLQGAREAAHVAVTGSDTTGKIEQGPAAINGQAFGLTGKAGKAMDVAGGAIRTPFRALSAEDAFFKTLNNTGTLWQMAVRIAVVQGAPDVIARAKQIVADPVGALGQKDGEALLEASWKDALYYTFNKELGAFGNRVMGVLHDDSVAGTIAQFIVPFFRTPVNIVKFAGERTPMAFLSKAVRAELAAGGAARDMALAKIISGTAIMGTVMAMAAAGMISGGGDPDKNVKRVAKSAGWQPYSVKIGNRWYSYQRFEPAGMLVGIASDLYEVRQYMEREDAEHWAAMLAMSAAQNLTSKTWIKGVSDVINAIADPERYGENYITGLTSTVVPSAVAQYTRASDPLLRDTDPGVAQEGMGNVERALWYQWEAHKRAIMAKVPGQSTKLPPKIDPVTGEPLKREEASYWNPVKVTTESNDNVLRDLRASRVAIGAPPKEVMGTKLTPEEKAAFHERAGRAGLGIARAINPAVEQALPALRDEAYKRAYDSGREIASASMVPEIGAQRITESRRNKLLKNVR